MKKVTIVIPNYNGIDYMDKCLSKLIMQDYGNINIIVVDNGSTDKSVDKVKEYCDRLDISILELKENYGFSKAVNEGIKASTGEYVILLNNDAYAKKDFVTELVKKMESDEGIFSAQALMLQYNQPDKIDSAGDFFSVLGWAFSKGKDKSADLYNEDREIFSSCAGAAIYRRKLFDEIGLFDEAFFAYLEDMDIGYRAKLLGYKNVLAAKAIVYHVGSASSGSRHNSFKVKLSSRNSFLVMYKNFSTWQRIVNAPFVGVGYLIKLTFFATKGLGMDYARGVKEYYSYRKNVVKSKSVSSHIYMELQKELFKNIWRK